MQVTDFGLTLLRTKLPCLVCLGSPVVVEVWVVRPLSLWQQVRHPCLELQQKEPGGHLRDEFGSLVAAELGDQENDDMQQQVFLIKIS